MKHIFVVAVAFGALALSPAMAQDHHPHSGDSSHSAPHPSGHGAPHGGGSHTGGSVHNEHRPAIRSVHTSRTVHVHPSHATVVHRETTVSRSHHVTVRNVSVHRHVIPVAAHRHVANVRELHRNFTAPRRFHHGAYVRPAGWYAHRWTYGERLPGGWYGHNYWIVNFSLFGLIYPPDGYEWIRVGDDALLVDIDTGEIIRVEYGVFY